MLVIGKAEKFWTLWNSISTDSETRYSYIKNISFDLETAKEKYPDAPILDWLKGTKDFVIYGDAPKKSYKTDIMPFGKHIGKHISDVSANYLKWMLNECDFSSKEEKEWFENTLPAIEEKFSKEGISVLKSNDKFIAVETDRIVEESSFDNFIENGKPFEIVLDKNLCQDGSILVENVLMNFEDFKTMEYAGYGYGLPTINGKAKRIKGKKIVIENYEVTIKNEFPRFIRENVYLKDFEILIKGWKMA